MSDDMTSEKLIDILLEEVPNDEWVVLKVVIKKNRKKWKVASGNGFGPFISKPKIIPE
jgi:hypothetical protein|tara:strand:+ start:81 stop:254 length:174 start_codon:yes stop_codon:yes gene_type:complete